MTTTLLLTGVSSYWGARVAAALAQAKAEEVRLLAFDRKPPPEPIPSLEFIRGNPNTPLTVDLLTAENVETVLYLDPSPAQQGGEFLALCALAGVRRIILKSSTAGYGAYPARSLYLSETHPLDPKPPAALRSLVELESFVNGLPAQYPDLTVTVLRFAHILGPTADTPLSRFLLNDRAPTLLGFNPLFQLLHEEDVVAALVHAALYDLPGVYNFAAEEALPLHKILALAGKLQLPVAHSFATNLPARLTPLPVEHLRYPCLAKLTRMQNDFGLTPTHTAEETVTEFATEVRQSRLMPNALDAVTNPLRDLVQRFSRTDDPSPE
jgi:UDP-glucose 4-epimerase